MHLYRINNLTDMFNLFKKNTCTAVTDKTISVKFNGDLVQ